MSLFFYLSYIINYNSLILLIYTIEILSYHFLCYRPLRRHQAPDIVADGQRNNDSDV